MLSCLSMKKPCCSDQMAFSRPAARRRTTSYVGVPLVSMLAEPVTRATARLPICFSYTRGKRSIPFAILGKKHLYSRYNSRGKKSSPGGKGDGAHPPGSYTFPVARHEEVSQPCPVMLYSTRGGR